MAHVEALTPMVVGDETESVARKLAAAYREYAVFHRDQMRASTEEALARATEIRDVEEQAAFLLSQPPDQMSWIALQALMEHDAVAGQRVWEHVKATAANELASGHRAGEPLDYHDDPWTRARFIALRQAFIDEWRPRGGLELSLIDTLAQTQSTYLFWLGQLHIWSMLECQREDPDLKRRGYWQPPRLDSVAAQEQAATMADRFNRLFLRTLRALRDLRRYPPQVIVQQAGQVNVGQQQVNVAGMPIRERMNE